MTDIDFQIVIDAAHSMKVAYFNARPFVSAKRVVESLPKTTGAHDGSCALVPTPATKQPKRFSDS